MVGIGGWGSFLEVKTKELIPDLTCLAKVVAGGTPGGLFGGRSDIMSLDDNDRNPCCGQGDGSVSTHLSSRFLTPGVPAPTPSADGSSPRCHRLRASERRIFPDEVSGSVLG